MSTPDPEFADFSDSEAEGYTSSEDTLIAEFTDSGGSGDEPLAPQQPPTN